MEKDQFIKEILKLGITPTKEQLDKLDKYYNLLIEWNQKINLTRITEENDVYLKHFYDSLTLNKAVDLSKVNNLLDVGTGAGFPGIVLKIFFPNIHVVLLDSLLKRLKFLEIVINELELKNIEIVHSRIEDYKENNFDVITTRAVANLSKLLKYINKIMTPKTKFVPMKAKVEEEISAAQSIILKYQMTISKKIDFSLPNNAGSRSILIIEKK
ncbi:MAG: 16S rRNA (guanine(527)-N(7))-methyltransferase RsmG [Bacilli bacterium]|nr:16S rRNA (guanine(527)-N(7))-methyltransferase RsmG [Bacilli bacterium]